MGTDDSENPNYIGTEHGELHGIAHDLDYDFTKACQRIRRLQGQVEYLSQVLREAKHRANECKNVYYQHHIVVDCERCGDAMGISISDFLMTRPKLCASCFGDIMEGDDGN